jgi:hypothetical protein
MRDIGTLVWVVLVFIGVIGSMISSARKQAQAQQAPGARAIRRPPPQQFAPQAPAPPAPVQPAPQPRVIARVAPAPTKAPPVLAQAHLEAEHHPARRRRLFANRSDLVRGIIAAEVLGKPRGLRGEDFPR